jgi:hypothetical protein
MKHLARGSKGGGQFGCVIALEKGTDLFISQTGRFWPISAFHGW